MRCNKACQPHQLAVCLCLGGGGIRSESGGARHTFQCIGIVKYLSTCPSGCKAASLISLSQHVITEATAPIFQPDRRGYFLCGDFLSPQKTGRNLLESHPLTRRGPFFPLLQQLAEVHSCWSTTHPPALLGASLRLRKPEEVLLHSFLNLRRAGRRSCPPGQKGSPLHPGRFDPKLTLQN